MASPQNRTTSGRFQPGVSGNPGGRPRKLSAYLKDQLTLEEWYERMIAEADNPKARPADRIMVLRDLADRMWGKAPSYAPVEGADPLEEDAISAEIRLLTDQLARRFDERTTGNGSSQAA